MLRPCQGVPQKVAASWPQRDSNPRYRLERADKRVFTASRRRSRSFVFPARDAFSGHPGFRGFPPVFIDAGNRWATECAPFVDDWRRWCAGLNPGRGTTQKGTVTTCGNAQPAGGDCGSRDPSDAVVAVGGRVISPRSLRFLSRRAGVRRLRTATSDYRCARSSGGGVASPPTARARPRARDGPWRA